MKFGVKLALIGSAVATGIAAGLFFVKKTETGKSMVATARAAMGKTKHRVDEMSEDVAVRTAQLTRNPQITQDYVSHQWEALGL